MPDERPAGVRYEEVGEEYFAKRRLRRYAHRGH